MAALYDFARIIEEYHAKKVFAVATSVVREAKNGEAFIEQIHKKTGIPVRILNGSEEARLTLKGVLSAVAQQTTNALVFDIGGGSTEFILTEGNRPLKVESTPLGVVFLSETLPTSDPPTPQELSRLSATIRKHLSLIDFHNLLPTVLPHGDPFPQSLIGTAGTVTTLAGAINNYRLSRETLLAIYQHLTTLTAVQRTAIPGLEKGRETVIIPGTAVVLEIMSLFGCNHLIVSDAGLLEGILLDRMDFH
jgi:exopolyphosphatase/guanosine-5'-triphosphate,3'-diphosphate pyrophosphatase